MGEATILLRFPDLPAKNWTFVVADVNHALIGTDLLNNLGLILDLKNDQIFLPNHHKGVPLVSPANLTSSAKILTSKLAPPFTSNLAPP